MTEAIRNVLSLAALGGGVLFFVAGTVGLLRFPDVFSRLHAVTKADTVGLGLGACGSGVDSAQRLVARRRDAAADLVGGDGLRRGYVSALRAL